MRARVHDDPKADDLLVVAPEGKTQLPVCRVRAGVAVEADDWLAEEVPVALEYNGISHAVMLATPLDLQDFALGFSLSEGILSRPAELYEFDEVRGPQGITLKLRIASGAFARLKERRRTLAGRTGCGLCGTEELSQVCRTLPHLPPAGTQMFGPAAIARALSQFQPRQALQQATGAVHAAAFCSPQGDVQLLREDVGRHNALDKLVGALARAGIDAASGFIAVTSRASFEMVQKAALAGAPLLAAVSAPTSFAVQTAREAGLTLVGFARQNDLVVYSHPERLALITPVHGEARHAH